MKLKRIIVLLCSFGIALCLSAQVIDLNLRAKVLTDVGKAKEGNEVTLINLTRKKAVVNGFIRHLFYLEDNQGNKYPIDKKLGETFDFKYQNNQDLWDGAIINHLLYDFKTNGSQNELRNEMEQDALKYIQKTKEYNLEFHDPYLENYIYSLIAKIAPERLLDGRPTNINILIQQNPALNACTYPNGTIVINTGLLSILHSEDELVAILAHEIAHFVLDHSIINVKKTEQRIKRAEFWSNFATGLAAATEVVAASTGKYKTPGLATIGVYALSSSLSTQIIERLGMEFNHDQEYEADYYANQILKVLGYDENAMASALSRIEDYYIKERDNSIYYKSCTHPNLISRIKKCGTPNKDCDITFEQQISFTITNLATMKYNDRRFAQCIPLVSQNIDNKVATSDDYILKASCLLALKNTPESNTEVLDLVQKAKSINTGAMINMYTTEIIANLRLNRKAEAVTLLNEYIEQLHLLEVDSEKYESDKVWEMTRTYVQTETDWAKRMLVKLQGMTF